jgi:hypothetical protein
MEIMQVMELMEMIVTAKTKLNLRDITTYN